MKDKPAEASKRFNPLPHLIGAVLLFALGVLLSRGPNLPSWESSLFLSIYNTPDSFHKIGLFITQLGDRYILLVILLAALLLRKWRMTIFMFLAGLTTYITAGLAKALFGRDRPHELIPNVIPLDQFHGPGFPSGHTAFAVVLALSLGLFIGRRYYLLLALWILAVAWSRIYLGVHLPADIIGGFAIGWFIYTLLRWSEPLAYGRFIFRIHKENTKESPTNN